MAEIQLNLSYLKNASHEKVNDTQYVIYDNIPTEYILGVDYLLQMDPTHIRQSGIEHLVDKYGKDKVKDILERYKNWNDIPFSKVKELTPILDWGD